MVAPLNTLRYRAGFLACGLGAGALGFVNAHAVVGRSVGRFDNAGGVDIDEAGLADFRYLVDGHAIRADIHTMTADELLAAWGPVAPQVVFSSTPCKGLSRLLGAEAASAEKYQALNRLTVEAFTLVLRAYATPPVFFLLENVPGMVSRGADLLVEIRALLSRHGYVFDERTHDCGELGGLGQHRRRFLLIARHAAQCPGLLFRPPKQRVKSCGEVIGTLPLPNDPAAGSLHELPRISWINWVRLALIPPGGDWRDLPQSGDVVPLGHSPHRDGHGVQDWDEPSKVVRGVSNPRTGPASVADPRVAVGATGTNAASFKGRPGYLGVNDWNEASPSVTGTMGATDGTSPGAVADPRLTSPLAPGQARREVIRRHKVQSWQEPHPTVTGPGANAVESVADPRVATSSWPGKHASKYRVRGFDEPTGAVTGDTDVQEGAPSVADERVALGCAPRAGAYGVAGWSQPAPTVTGSAAIDNGTVAVADPRVPPLPPGYQVFTIEEALALAKTPKTQPPKGVIPVIYSPTDGTWHRPMTTLELAVLQGLPARVNGEPLSLAGKSAAAHRERIGNAVPVGAAMAIASEVLRTLVHNTLGLFALGATPIWCREAPLSPSYAEVYRRRPARVPTRAQFAPRAEERAA